MELPRTFEQLNLELHTALARAGERGPFVLVGHSFGAGAVRNYAARYPAAHAQDGDQWPVAPDASTLA